MRWIEIEISNDIFPGSRCLTVYGNPKEVYQIAGSNETEQLQNIKDLGESMQNGRDELTDKISDYIDIDKENITDMDSFIDGLFGTADDFVIDGVMASTTIEILDGQSLLDVLVTAGEWIAEMIVV